MKRYTATLVAKFHIDAENIVQARLAAKRIKALGQVVGARLAGPHERDVARFKAVKVSEVVRVEREEPT